MSIRMTGLASGLDTESIVAALMEAQKSKKTKVENKKTKLEWTQKIWSNLNTKLYSFYTDYAGKMRFQSSYQTKKATSSDSSVLTATAKSTAANGSYRVQVKQLAAAQYVTSAKLGKYTTQDTSGNETENAVTSKTKLSDLGMASDGSSVIQITAGDKNINLTVDENTTVADFVSSLSDAGLNASFDEKQSRFFISAKDSGADGKFTITNSKLSDAQMTARTNLLNAVGYDSLSSSEKSSVQSVLDSLIESQDTDTVTAAEGSLQKIADDAAKSKATAYYTDQLTAEYLEKYTTTATKVHENGVEETTTVVSDAGKAAMVEAGLIEKQEQYDEEAILKTLKEKFIPQSVKADLADEEKGYSAKIQDAVTNGLSEAGVLSKSDRDAAIVIAVEGSEDATTGTKVVGYADAMKSGIEEGSDLSYLGMDNIDGSAVAEKVDATTGETSGMAVIAAADSIVQVNGATLNSSTTTMEVNGLTLNLTGVSDKEVTVSVANDTAGVYDSIKDFVEQYNTILAELNEYYYADSARGYDPLTDDQKEAMSDDEVEKWETKIKDSLLRRDTTLNSILETMRSSMTSYTVTASNGKTYSLANLGITTGEDYKEYGLLHIKGDEDDTDYADETNTLENMISEDPNTVMEVLSGVVSELYNNLSKKMSATTLSSALTFYNDKEITSQLDDYEDEIDDWEDKLADMEDRYYEQFTAMEKALANLQSQQSSLSSYLG